MRSSSPVRVLTFPHLAIAVLLPWLLPAHALAAQDAFLDHYVLVDVGAKYYRFWMQDELRGELDLEGAFTSNVVISPTARLRERLADGALGFSIDAGLAYGHHSDTRVAVDSFEWQFGLGGTLALTSWAHLGIACNVGYGLTWVELPTTLRSVSGDDTDLGISSHGEALATLTCTWRGATLVLGAGYRATQLQIEDLECLRRHDYLIHGAVLAAGFGFTF